MSGTQRVKLVNAYLMIITPILRYVYQPMDNLYLLLITNRASNIVEDLETLRLLSKGYLKIFLYLPPPLVIYCIIFNDLL